MGIPLAGGGRAGLAVDGRDDRPTHAGREAVGEDFRLDGAACFAPFRGGDGLDADPCHPSLARSAYGHPRARREHRGAALVRRPARHAVPAALCPDGELRLAGVRVLHEPGGLRHLGALHRRDPRRDAALPRCPALRDRHRPRPHRPGGHGLPLLPVDGASGHAGAGVGEEPAAWHQVGGRFAWQRHVRVRALREAERRLQGRAGWSRRHGLSVAVCRARGRYAAR